MIPLSVFALLGGGWIQHVRPELPGAYTWLQPYDTLKMIVQLRGFPTGVVVAYLLGAGARPGSGGLRDSLAALRRLELAPQRRMPLLLRVLLGVMLTALDVVFLPHHGPLDAIAVGVAGGLLAKAYPRETWQRLVWHTACAALVFTAVCYWFTVVKALTFVGSTQRDADILALEHALTGIYPHRWVAAWASERPTWVRWFDWAYLRIFDHMAVTTAFLLGLRDLRQRTEYLAALAICYLLGAPLYLLCPAAGPAYFDPAQFMFLREQELTVNYVQSALYRNTAAVNDGRARALITWSYIACMPSLHMAHETVMLFYVRASRPALAISLAFIVLTGVAVVALGWHYPTDILAGFALATMAILVARWQSARLLPRIVTAAAPWIGPKAASPTSEE